MKSHIVRARVEPEIKAKASEVLASHGLDLSDGIRLFLRQVIAQGGLPFPIGGQRGPRIASARRLQRMKQRSQERDRALIARGMLAHGELFLVRPDAARAAKVEWPEGRLSD